MQFSKKKQLPHVPPSAIVQLNTTEERVGMLRATDISGDIPDPQTLSADTLESAGLDSLRADDDISQARPGVSTCS